MTVGYMRFAAIAALLASAVVAGARPAPPKAAAADLWTLANQKKSVHRISTLFTAQDVKKYLSTNEGIETAINWCRATGVTKVYVESFRAGYQAPREVLANARDLLRRAGIEVSGCVTTVNVGKPSTGWKGLIGCYTDRDTQDRLAQIFTFTAGLFDEIMIDDFWFTDCACPECDAARRARTVRIGDEIYPVAGESWEDYRCELMVRLSQDRVLKPAKQANPKVRLIIKYPQWYDSFHERGYEVMRESADFDRIWVGTETRNYADKQWGGTPQYEAFFIMRWLGGIGGAKCGGGWFDPYGTTEATYVEQARQTVLGGARESLLFCYGSLQEGTGPRNVEAFRAAVPELLTVAAEVKKRSLSGIAAYKPPNSHPDREARVYDFVGMLGLPLVPCHTFPDRARAAFFSTHAMKDPELIPKLTKFIASGRTVLITDGLAKLLAGKVRLDRLNVRILPVEGDPKRLLEMTEDELQPIRQAMIQPSGCSFHAPPRVGLYLFSDGSWVAENFNDTAVTVELNGQSVAIPPRAWTCHWGNHQAG